MLRALLLTDVDGRSGFDYIAADGSGGETGWHVVGTIDAGGTIHAGGMIDAGGTMAVSRRDPSSLGLGSDPNRLHQGGSNDHTPRDAAVPFYALVHTAWTAWSRHFATRGKRSGQIVGHVGV